MKNSILLLWLLTCIEGASQAQTAYPVTLPTYVESFPVEVTLNKTTNLLFHYRIKNVAVGSDDIDAQQINDTALLVKAGKENFIETNLSVFTSDGLLHLFSVRFVTELLHPAIYVDATGNNTVSRSGDLMPLTEDKLKAYAQTAKSRAAMWSGHKDKDFGVAVKLSGIYTARDVIFFPFELRNTSKVSYDINEMRFFIRDQKRAKRTATQEIEIKPVYSLGNVVNIPGDGKQVVVFALPKFTIPHKKYLHIIILEKDGGRSLHIDLRNRALVKARLL